MTTHPLLRPVTPASVLASALEELCEQARTEEVSEAFSASLLEALDLAAGLDPYLAQCSSPESPALAALAARTRALDWGAADAPADLEAEMLSGHVEGQLLKILVHAVRAESVLEVGMFTGYSALAMAEALPPHGRVVTCEIDPGVAAFAKYCLAGSVDAAKIDVRLGPARDTLKKLAAAGKTFDLVFIDADKAGYVDYYQAIVGSGLLSEHGLLCIDNTLMQGQAYARTRGGLGATIHDLNETVAADPRVRQVLLPLRDGVTLVQRVPATTV